MSEEEEEIIIIEEEEYYEDSSSDDVVIDFGPPKEPDGPTVLEYKTPEQIKQYRLKKMMEEYNVDTPDKNRAMLDYFNLTEAIKKNPSDYTFTIDLYENRIDVWNVHIIKFSGELAEDMKKFEKEAHQNYIELRVTFPPTYPINPPFIRFVYPRIVPGSGFVMGGGSICNSSLTLTHEDGGWSPIYDFEALFLNILSLCDSNNLRVDFTNKTPYTVDEALKSFRMSSQSHNWKMPPMHNWKPF